MTAQPHIARHAEGARRVDKRRSNQCEICVDNDKETGRARRISESKRIVPPAECVRPPGRAGEWCPESKYARNTAVSSELNRQNRVGNAGPRGCWQNVRAALFRRHEQPIGNREAPAGYH